MRIGTQRFGALALALVALLARLTAAEPWPEVGLGASREDVIRVHGQPQGVSRAGAREILRFTRGQVTLENGKVVNVDVFGGDEAPTQRAGAGRWLADFDEATREAARRKVHVLALFTGPEGSVASRYFLEQVALHPEFTRIFADDYVFLRVDFVTKPTAAMARLAEQGGRLRSLYAVEAFPMLLLLTTTGERVGGVDFARSPLTPELRTEAIRALREIRARIALGVGAPTAASMPATKVPPVPLMADRPTVFTLMLELRSMEALLEISIISGFAISLVLLWLLWRAKRTRKGASAEDHAARIAAAASGVPSMAQIRVWSREEVVAAAVVLAEAEGFEAATVSHAPDGEVVLSRHGEIYPSLAVGCSEGSRGVVSTQALRNFRDVLTHEGVHAGWYVAPAGFSNDARAYAGEHDLLLIDADVLHTRLRQLPPFQLAKLPKGRVS